MNSRNAPLFSRSPRSLTFHVKIFSNHCFVPPFFSVTDLFCYSESWKNCFVPSKGMQQISSGSFGRSGWGRRSLSLSSTSLRAFSSSLSELKWTLPIFSLSSLLPLNILVSLGPSLLHLDLRCDGLLPHLWSLHFHGTTDGGEAIVIVAERMRLRRRLLDGVVDLSFFELRVYLLIVYSKVMIIFESIYF